jgi:hypothetical protein
MAGEIEKIELNPNLEDELKKFPLLQTSTFEVAKAIAERARSLAPVMTGRYRDGIEAQPPNAKGTSRVYASDQKSSWIEFGNRDGLQAPQFVMRNAVESLGLKFSKRGR